MDKKIEKVYEQLEIFEADFYGRAKNFLEPLIQKEFDKARKKQPQLEKIIFGNGTYVIVGLEKQIWTMTGVRSTIYGAVGDYKLTCPKYMHLLIHLCELATTYGIEDIFPSKI